MLRPSCSYHFDDPSYVWSVSWMRLLAVATIAAVVLVATLLAAVAALAAAAPVGAATAVRTTLLGLVAATATA
jgi:hypothetical protein